MSAPLASVVIPNWNGRMLLQTCLASLRRQTCRDFEIIVVDNGSSDGSAEMIQACYPEVRLIRLSRNEGFSRAINRGIRAAAGKYIALLNNDTEADPKWLGELIKALEQNPEAGFCASKMLNFFQRNLIDNAGDRLAFYGNITGKGEIDAGQYDRPRWLFSACAGAAIYRREMLMETGLFDEDFFAYYEDVDLGLRAQLMGYRCLYVPTAVVYHIHQATSDRMPARRFLFLQRNIVFVHLKNLPLKLLLKMLPAFLAVHLLVSLIYLAKTRDLKTVLSIYLQLVKNLPATLKKRQAVQKKRKVPAAYIESITGPFPSLSSLAARWLKKLFGPGKSRAENKTPAS
ncbi:MAG: glycosyltransferase family 2 protein [Pelotomaculum sp.]|uniref:Predicted glycosyltransferases n=1 Tax=Pelotomaculum thermopropionicum (strain DSM 13744 / JCM 10971 / SI) TaxID=370438 RepID=A5D3A4_PELTS|nr:glycosyltransferase family 2 protein [Pelotomaculum sp.]BAF59265.1 predicted glycosyltransferases [Pelotomaculum thermopropionicum SI]